MQIFRNYSVIFLIAILVQSCATVPTEVISNPSGKIVSFGIYAYSKNGGRSWVNPISTSPTIWEGRDAVLVKKTDKIPLIKDINFAFEYELKGLPDGEVKLDWTVSHPKIVKPDGTTSTGYSYKRSVLVEKGKAEGWSGYILNQDYELVTGKWTFSYSYNGIVLVKKTFTIYFNKNS